jgi:hypothetical protein
MDSSRGEIEKPSSQYLSLIGDESLTCRCLNSNTGHFGSFTFILWFVWRIALLVSWCAVGRYGIAGSDEERGRSMRPGTEDRG